MDTDSFDSLARTLSGTPSRRGIARVMAGLVLSGVAASGLGLRAADARKKRKKKKRKTPANTPAAPAVACTPNCAGKTCGANGCGGSCGSCTGGTTCCGGSCVNLETDEIHCGECDALCAVDEVCQTGDCFPSSTCPANPADPSFCASGVCNSGGGLCKCATSAEGNVICAENKIFCNTPPLTTCQTSTDCSGGDACVDVGGCCEATAVGTLPVGTKICLAPCLNPL